MKLGKFPEYYKQPQFEIITNGEPLTQSRIGSHSLDIRVYNKDYINEHLSFLKDGAEGEIKTFAILGSENKEIERQIDEKLLKLGSVEGKQG